MFSVSEISGCVLTFESNYQEWQSVPEYLGTPIQWGHAVCGVDFTLYNGKKSIIVSESWGIGATQFNAQRVITSDFITARCTGAMYFLFDETTFPVKPIHTFTRDFSIHTINKLLCDGQTKTSSSVLPFEIGI